VKAGLSRGGQVAVGASLSVTQWGRRQLRRWWPAKSLGAQLGPGAEPGRSAFSERGSEPLHRRRCRPFCRRRAERSRARVTTRWTR